MTVIDFFKEICKIPHGSKNEAAIASFIEETAKKHGLLCIKDDLNNVYVRKPASKGYENKSPILFAAHTDMVCEKLPSSTHDFSKDAIEVTEKNGKLYANGTTLGGDDGAGVAIMLALMTDSDLIAPVTEYLFTSDEEAGMSGAAGFDYSHVLSERVVNLDTGWENGVCISCASGYRYELKLPVDRTRKCGKAVKIGISGLAGGHSGVEIDAGRQSAVKLLGTLLDEIYSSYPFHIVELVCDGKTNVIPSSAEATVIFYDTGDEKRAKETVSAFERDIRPLLCKADAKKFKAAVRRLNTADTDALDDMLTLKSTSAVIDAIMLSPQGVISRFPDKTDALSSVNLGIVTTSKKELSLHYLTRSASERSDKILCQMLNRLAHTLGASVDLHSYHTCWEYRRPTALQELYEKAYSKVFDGIPEFFATHAGLECGTFYSKLTALGKSPDVISIGPNMYDIHTPKEALDIASVNRIYSVAKELLKLS